MLVASHLSYWLLALYGCIPIMHWLLTEGGSSLTGQSPMCKSLSALVIAAGAGRFPAMQWLLEEQGAFSFESDIFGHTV
jgi:hypothetical protein